MSGIVTLSEEAFLERFRPLPNCCRDSASCDFGDGGCLYETFGDEFETVCQADDAHVWTLIEDEGLCLVSGRHFANRLGYILTALPWTEGDTVIVDLYD